MKNIFFFLFILFNVLFFNILYAQYTNVLISSTADPSETSIMMDPKHPNIIVAGANIYTPNSWSGFYYTTNAGLNWTSGAMSSNVAFPSGDPVILVDTLGNFYYLQNCNGLYNPPNPNYDRILLCKSTNGGMNWNNGTSIGIVTNGKFQDKPWGCVDFTHSPYGNNIYVAWTQFDNYYSNNPNDSSIIRFSRSTDGGITFNTPIRINRYAGNCRDSSLTVEGATPCIGLNGEVFIAWAGPLGILFNKSTNGGVTWMQTESIVVPAYPGGWAYEIPGIMRCDGFPVTACDLSNGPYRGNLYINWSDQRNGSTDTDIWLIKSTNGGVNWSTIKRINNDPPGRHQFLNWMAIDQVTGYIYFVFYDRRSNSGLTNDVYVVRSTDGGETFLNIRVNTNSFVTTGYVNIGDYIGITAHNNKVRPIWTSANGQNTSIWTAIIDSITIGVKKIGENVPECFSLMQNFPNPFNPVTKIRFDIKSEVRSQESEVKLIIYDILGKEVVMLVNETLQPGKYEVTFDARLANGQGSNLPSGVYFYRLQAGDFSDIKK